MRLGRNTRSRAKALSGSELAIGAVRPAQGQRTAGGAGAPPRKRPWLVQAGLSERSLPGSFLAGRQGTARAVENDVTHSPNQSHSPFRTLSWAYVTMMMLIRESENPRRFSFRIGR